MHQLKLKFHNIYKSFPSEFETTFDGSLVIISGVNGSGKSQILDAIRGYEYQNINSAIDAEVTLDGVQLSRRDIFYRSFKDNVNLPNITRGGIDVVNNARSQIQSNYDSNLLNPDDPNTRQNQRAVRNARQLLIEAYGEERFNAKQITTQEIAKVINHDFVWSNEDVFTNTVGEIFYRYCMDEHNIHASASRARRRADLTGLGKAPWAELNELFSKLHLDYRFKDNYQIVNGIDIDEQPILYSIDSSGNIDPSSTRDLSQLSDGEKALISLCFASLNGSEEKEAKLVLLDEYDATLNPSLVQDMFTVIDEYFLSRGIMVLLVSHSAATISLAPEISTFYEVYKPTTGNERVLKVSKGHYEDLKPVHQAFYDQISNQTQRLNDILAENRRLEEANKKLAELVNDSPEKPIIITEGKTDATLVKAALTKLGLLDGLDVEFFEPDDPGKEFGSSVLATRLQHLASVPRRNKIIGIFDRDEKSYVDLVGDLKDYGNNVYAFCLPIPENRVDYQNISIEFYFTDGEIHKSKNGKQLYFDNEIEELFSNVNGNRLEKLQSPIAEKEYIKKIYDSAKMCETTPWIHSKTRFATLVSEDQDFTESFDFTNFRLIYDKIRSILQI